MSDQNGNQEQPEIIIVGAGPAGQSAALYAGRSRIPTLVLERGIAGGQLWNTAEVEDYPGFEHIMGPDLAERMQKHAEKFGARFEVAEVESVGVDGEEVSTGTEPIGCMHDCAMVVHPSGSRGVCESSGRPGVSAPLRRGWPCAGRRCSGP